MLALRDNPFYVHAYTRWRFRVSKLRISRWSLLPAESWKLLRGLPNRRHVVFSLRHLVFSFTGDFEGHASVGPSSPCAPRQFRIVGGLHGAQRSATYLCPFLTPVNVASFFFLSKSYRAPQRLVSRLAHSSTARYRPEASWTCIASHLGSFLLYLWESNSGCVVPS